MRAYLDPHIKPTISARCKDSEISRTTFYKEMRKPQFSSWFRSMLAEAVLSDSPDVRLAHLKLCLDGDLQAIRLWYEHYGHQNAHCLQ